MLSLDRDLPTLTKKFSQTNMYDTFYNSFPTAAQVTCAAIGNVGSEGIFTPHFRFFKV